MTTFTEGLHAAEFIVSEANGFRSRTEIVLATPAADLSAGEVLGIITASGKWAVHDPNAVDGTEVAAGILYEGRPLNVADVDAVAITGDAEVHAASLVWDAGITGPQQVTAEGELDALGIKIRT